MRMNALGAVNDDLPERNGASRVFGWLRARGPSAGLIVLGLGFVWLYNHRDDTIRTRHLEIVDSAGNICATFGPVAGSRTELALRDAKGNTRASLCLGHGDTPSLVLRDRDGMPRAIMEVSPKGHSAMRLLNGQSQLRVAMDVDNAGAAVVKVTDWTGKQQAALKLDGSGPSVEVTNDAARKSAAPATKPVSREPAQPLPVVVRASALVRPDQNLTRSIVD